MCSFYPSFGPVRLKFKVFLSRRLVSAQIIVLTGGKGKIREREQQIEKIKKTIEKIKKTIKRFLNANDIGLSWRGEKK